MSQHDMVIDNQGTPAFRADLNSALQALASTSKGGAAPSTPYAGQLWLDDSATPWLLKGYNGTAWIVLGAINATVKSFALRDQDGDTLIQVEESADEDTVRMDVGGAEAFVLSAAGGLQLPLQPAVVAFNSATDSNATGDGTVATVDFDTEVVDRNNDFASDTFTAPVAGLYQFDVVVRLSGLASGHTEARLELVTSNATYILDLNAGGALRTAANELTLRGSICADMDAADTAYVQVTVSGGSKVVSILGNASARWTCFTARLAA